MPAILVAESISKSFGTRSILRSATIRAIPGAVRLLIGQNGVGKSTLLRIAAGVLRADAGLVTFRDVTFPRPLLEVLARRGLFYIPDRGLFSTAFPIGAQLEALRRRFHGTSPHLAASTVELSQKLNCRTWELSTGELRRAEAAAALVRQPTCLIADELLRSVSPVDSARIAESLRTLASAGCAIVMSGHSAAHLSRYIDDVVVCSNGRTSDS